ncbi:MAG: NAD(P)-dependent alcohol dehydrogenase [Myxococcaceae bacterium]|nr:NAD(P)-dependent alcohol dehydrogenase [Myxococcaceae bacterium]
MNTVTPTMTQPRQAVVRQQTMQAVTQRAYGPLDGLRFDTTAVPSHAENEVLVRVHSAGLDRGTWHLMTGRPYLLRLMGFGFLAPKNPVLGRDLAGVVAAVGAKVTRFKVGDAVFGMGEGSFAEFARAREDKLSLKPAALSFAQAAVLGVSGSTALQAVRAARVQAGQRVLVVGASGGVGSYAVQMAKALGAHVTGVCSLAKADWVRSLGADDVIAYENSDFTRGFEPWHAVLDMGGNTALTRIRRVLAPQGTLVFVGGENGGDWSAGFGRQLLALAMAPFVRQRFVMLMNREHHTELEALLALLAEGKVSPFIDSTWPLAHADQAMRALEAGQVRGKVAITVNDSVK